ncbi:MAG: tRNA (adenosine(37)-N6)-dimethylallyltransferase MiaA [Dehalococcoidia bacterium]|nr:tRNA (adenosine(37)-N6)-dimethylallyltransferase MiaA [Dehalococcoidia bacterium]
MFDDHSSVRRPLLAVVGATATGKSDVAIALAKTFDGEVVNTDAYQLYRGLDIGAAKLDAATRQRVPHHMIDITDPDEPLTLAGYLDAANAAMEDVWSRGRLPILAGGSGQYVWAIIEGWQVPRVAPDKALRDELEAFATAEGPAAVHARLAAIDPEAASRLDPNNLRRVVRALEVVTCTGLPLAACQTRSPVDADVFILGLRLDRDEHYRRLDQRAEAMFAAGLVGEVKDLRDQGYGETQQLRGGIGYKEVSQYLEGDIDLDEALRRTKNANHRLVRRQGAWFKDTDPRIHWLDAGNLLIESSITVVADWLRSRQQSY